MLWFDTVGTRAHMSIELEKQYSLHLNTATTEFSMV
jgi:hypothetical protein